MNALGPYDAVDLLARSGALQLLPQNAGHLVRLEALTHCAYLLSVRSAGIGNGPVSSAIVSSVCNTLPDGLVELAHGEDPPEQPFTEAVTFHGGTFTVFPGINSGSAFILRQLFAAVFLSNRLVDEVLEGQGMRLCLAALTVSDEVARRAGLGRGVAPQDSTGDVLVPDTDTLERLANAVRISDLEMAQLLQAHRLTTEDLASLVATEVPADESWHPTTGPLVARPLVRSASGWIVAMPSGFVVAIRHYLLQLAKERGIFPALADTLLAAHWRAVSAAMERMNIRQIKAKLPTHSSGFRGEEGVFRFDRDKLAHVVLVVDDLEGYGNDPFGTWSPPGLSEAIAERVRAVEAHLYAGSPAPNELLVLIVHGGVGRGVVLPIAKESQNPLTRTLILAAMDLETIALLEPSNPLELYEFTRSRDEIHRRARVLAWNAFDEYVLYRKNGHSYYVSDGPTPTLITVATDGAVLDRVEALELYDFHAVPADDSGALVEVERRHRTSLIPVYGPRESAPTIPSLLVEGLPLPVWVIPVLMSEGDSRADERGSQEGAIPPTQLWNLVDAVAYWIWQFTPILIPALMPVERLWKTLRIRVVWETTAGVGVQGEGDTTTGEVTLAFGERFLTEIETADNRGERDMVRELLISIRAALADRSDALEDSVIAAAIEEYAPLGRKKMMLAITSAHRPDLDTRNLPRRRLLQAPALERALDLIGAHLSEGDVPEGDIPAEERTRILEGVVGHLYEWMSVRVHELQHDSLMESLIARNEALVSGRAHHRLTMPTRLACFASDPTMLTHIGKELQDYVGASMANRFLIEYVAAKPPRGLRPLSLSVFDELQGLAAEIISWAGDSDLIHFGLVDIPMARLPSGRLGTNRQLFLEAQRSFFRGFTEEEGIRAAKRFDSLWQTSVLGGEASAEAQAVDEATSAECGFRLSELLSWFGASVDVALGFDDPTAVLAFEEFCEAMQSRLDWPRTRIEEALAALSISERSDFLVPPHPFSRQDVLPWKFSRRYSYLRRPYILRQGDQLEVLWGRRHVFQAGEHLRSSIFSGRVMPASREMRELMGRFRNEDGEAFNDYVADELNARVGLIVRRRVKKLLGMKLSQIAGGSGDVDVLVADTRERILWLTECKDLLPGRTAGEIRNELQSLTTDGPSKPSTVGRVETTLGWVRTNLGPVLSGLGISDSQGWTAKGVIVVSRDIMTPYFAGTSVPIMTVRAFMSNLQ